jgi:hypothetical protein
MSEKNYLIKMIVSEKKLISAGFFGEDSGLTCSRQERICWKILDTVQTGKGLESRRRISGAVDRPPYRYMTERSLKHYLRNLTHPKITRFTNLTLP